MNWLHNAKLSYATFDGPSNHQTVPRFVHEQRTRNVRKSGGTNEHRHVRLLFDLLQASLLIGSRNVSLHCDLQEFGRVAAGQRISQTVHVAKRSIAQWTVRRIVETAIQTNLHNKKLLFFLRIKISFKNPYQTVCVTALRNHRIPKRTQTKDTIEIGRINQARINLQQTTVSIYF